MLADWTVFAFQLRESFPIRSRFIEPKTKNWDLRNYRIVYGLLQRARNIMYREIFAPIYLTENVTYLGVIANLFFHYFSVSMRITEITEIMSQNLCYSYLGRALPALDKLTIKIRIGFDYLTLRLYYAIDCAIRVVRPVTDPYRLSFLALSVGILGLETQVDMANAWCGWDLAWNVVSKMIGTQSKASRIGIQFL